MMQDLAKVSCTGANDGAGVDGRTAIHISMFRWGGDRGMYIAKRLLQLQREGCRVSMIYGAPSRVIAALLKDAARAGRIELYDSRRDRNGDGWSDLRVHSKYLLINGRFAGDPSSWQVFTGSQNWGFSSLTRVTSCSWESRAVEPTPSTAQTGTTSESNRARSAVSPDRWMAGGGSLNACLRLPEAVRPLGEPFIHSGSPHGVHGVPLLITDDPTIVNGLASTPVRSIANSFPCALPGPRPVPTRSAAVRPTVLRCPVRRGR